MVQIKRRRRAVTCKCAFEHSVRFSTTVEVVVVLLLPPEERHGVEEEGGDRRFSSSSDVAFASDREQHSCQYCRRLSSK